MDDLATERSNGAWLRSQGEAIAQAAIAAIPANASAAMKAAEMQKLIEILQRFREFDRWGRLQIPNVVREENYGIVDQISVGGCQNALQVLPAGRIVSGGDDKTVRIWSKGGDGKWSAEVLEGHTNWIRCLQALPDGRIVSGSDEGTIHVWDGEEVTGGAA